MLEEHGRELVKVEAKVLRDAIARGIESLVGHTIQLTGERGEDVV